MSSEAQLIANRQNALKSSGPKTGKGKAKAAINALRHGILSQHLLVEGESKHELGSFYDSLRVALCPMGELEELLVEKIISAGWRLRRAIIAEGSAFFASDWMGKPTSLYESFEGRRGDRLNAISRYEASLERSMYRALHELQRIQGMRLGQTVLAPIAIEVSAEASPSEIGFVS